MLAKLRLNVADINNSFYQDLNLTLNLSEEEGLIDILKKLLCIGLYAFESTDIDKEGPHSQQPFLSRRNLNDEIDFAVEYRFVEDKILKSFFNRSQKRKFVFFNPEEQAAYIKKHKELFAKHTQDFIRIEFDENVTSSLEETYFKRAKEATITIDGSEIYVNFDDFSFVGNINEH